MNCSRKLTAATSGLDLSPEERKTLLWLSNWDKATIDNVASIIQKARNGRGPFADLLSAAEAADLWNIDDSAIRKAALDGRLTEGKDCKKFGKQWIITRKAMRKVFGKPRT